MRKRFKINKLVVLGIICLCISFQRCSLTDLSDKNQQITKEEIYGLAHKYNFPVELIDNFESAGGDVPSLEQLEKIFISYKNSRDKKFEKRMEMKVDGNKVLFRTERKEFPKFGKVRFKSGEVEGGMWSDDKWYYDLTWLDVDVSWQEDDDGLNVNISSNYNGVSFYEYVQDNFTYRTSGDTIFYSISGTQSMTLGYKDVGIHFSDDVNAGGWVNRATGEGVLKVDKSDYWF